MRRLGVAVTLAVALACRGGGGPPATAGGGDEVVVDRARLDRGEAEVVTAVEKDVTQAVVAAGRVAFDDQRVQHVLSPVTGRVARVLAHPGQRVAKGTPLVSLVSPDVGAAFSDLVKAQADLAQADAELARQRTLIAAHAGPERDLEAAEDAARRANAELERARERAALLKAGDVDAVTQELTLKAAIPGEVIARSASPGTWVQGAYSGGTPVELFTVGDISRVWILADLPEEELGRVAVGARARVTVAAWPGRVFGGAVDWVADTLDPALRTGRVRISLDNADHALKPEMLAQVAIETAPRRALAVPREAIATVEGDAYAWVADGAPAQGRQRFVRRRVRTAGDPSEPLATVADGLAPGDRLLVDEEAPRGGAPAEPEVHVTRAQAERSGLRVATVGDAALEDALLAGGRVAFDEQRVAHVSSPVTGRVVRVLAEPGQRVRRGAPLAVLVSPDVGTALSDAAKAEADEVAARHEATRRRELVEAHAGARKDLEAAEATWRKAQAELARARQKAGLLESGSFDAVRQELTLRSPIDGDVVARAATPGLEVQGQWEGAGAPVELFTVGALDPLWMMGDVYEMDLPHVRRGDAVSVRVPALPGRSFQGTVDWVSDVLDPVLRTGKVRCIIPNPDRKLRPEMAPVLSIAIPARRRVAVPREAILRLGDDDIVFVAAGKSDGGELLFRRRRVIVGEDPASGRVPIADGLVAGESVVVRGGIFLVGLL